MNILVRGMNPVTSFSTSERLAEILESYIGGRSAVIQSERIISPSHLQLPLYARDLPGAGASKWVTSLTFVTLITRSYCEGKNSSNISLACTQNSRMSRIRFSGTVPFISCELFIAGVQTKTSEVIISTGALAATKGCEPCTLKMLSSL